MAVAEVSHRSVQALAVSVVHESTRIFSSTDMMACGTSQSAPHSNRYGAASGCLHEGKARTITLPMTQLPFAQRIEDGLPSLGQDPLFSKSEGAMPGPAAQSARLATVAGDLETEFGSEPNRQACAYRPQQPTGSYKLPACLEFGIQRMVQVWDIVNCTAIVSRAPL